MSRYEIDHSGKVGDGTEDRAGVMYCLGRNNKMMAATVDATYITSSSDRTTRTASAPTKHIQGILIQDGG